MSNFRTFGWFGPKCPSQAIVPNIVFSVHDYNNPIPAPQPIGGNVNFPLDVAMKIFWEAETYRFVSDISATVGGVTRSDLKDITLQWGEVGDNFPFYEPRQLVNTAKDMLCIIQRGISDPSGSHTFYRENGGGISFNCGINPLTFIHQNVLSFAIFCQHDISGLFPTSDAQQFIPNAGFQGSYSLGTFNLNTPWGNFTPPLAYRTVTPSLTITVTATDPEVRYS